MAKLIPDRGAWIEFDLAPGEVLSVKIDNRKKIPVSMMLRAFGIQTTEELLSLFGAKEVERDLVEDEVRGMLLAEACWRFMDEARIHGGAADSDEKQGHKRRVFAERHEQNH